MLVMSLLASFSSSILVCLRAAVLVFPKHCSPIDLVRFEVVQRLPPQRFIGVQRTILALRSQTLRFDCSHDLENRTRPFWPLGVNSDCGAQVVHDRHE